MPGLSGRRIVVRARSGRRQRSWLLDPSLDLALRARLRRFRNRSRDFCRRPHPGHPPSRARARWLGRADRRGRTLLCNSLSGLRRASAGSSRERRANTAMQRSASPNERQARDILDSHALAVSRLHLFLQCVNAGQGTQRQFLIAGTTAAVPTRGTKAITASLAASEGEP